MRDQTITTVTCTKLHKFLLVVFNIFAQTDAQPDTRTNMHGQTPPDRHHLLRTLISTDCRTASHQLLTRLNIWKHPVSACRSVHIVNLLRVRNERFLRHHYTITNVLLRNMAHGCSVTLRWYRSVSSKCFWRVICCYTLSCIISSAFRPSLP